MKTRMIILSIAIFVGSIYGGHWRFISDTVRVRVDTSCAMCAWGTAETDTSITVGHWCMAPPYSTIVGSLLYNEYYKDATLHSIWAYKGDCRENGQGNPFRLCGDPPDSAKWVHFWDTFTIDEDWTGGGQLCSLGVFCFSVPYENEISVKINSHTIIDRYERYSCSWVCIRGDEWGVDSDSASLWVHAGANTLEVCQRTKIPDTCGGLSYILDIFTGPESGEEFAGITVEDGLTLPVRIASVIYSLSG